MNTKIANYRSYTFLALFLSLIFFHIPLCAQIERYFFRSHSSELASLDAIFQQFPHAFDSENSLIDAGFTIVCHQPKSKIVVIKHQTLPGYLIKGYLESEIDRNTYQQNLLNRCIGADNIRSLIKKKKIRHFTVPDKYLYTLPNETLILLVTDMKIHDSFKSRLAWKEKATKEHLRELYIILSHGYASCWLAENIPYTKKGTFACIDTEYPQRKLDLTKTKKYFSKKMQSYWKRLIRDNKK
jgi:hypothetical protein